MLFKQTLGYLSPNCKNIQNNSNNKIDQSNLLVPNTISDPDTFSPLIKQSSHEERQTNSKTDDNLPSPLLNDNPDKNPSDSTLYQETSKRPAPESSSTLSPSAPTSPKISNEDKKLTIIKSKNSKKPKIRSRSSSSTKRTDKLDEQLEPVFHIFAQNNDLPIDFNLFKYFLENFTNKNANINDLCKQIGTDIPNLLKIVQLVRPSLTDRSIKIKMTKLANLLF